MKIHNIRIQNVRGISDYTITDDIAKNKPHILVAPNGFGKTSIAKAFKNAADQTSIKLNDDNRHFHDTSKLASLSLDFNDGHSTLSLSVTEYAHSNEIRKEFDILVISDLREITASSKSWSGFSTKAKGKQIIPPIVICPVINKPTNPYKITDVKNLFGEKRQYLQNLSTTLFTQEAFRERATQISDLVDRLVMTRLWNRIESIRNTINTFSGDDASLRQAVMVEISTLRGENEDFAAAINLIEKASNFDAFNSFLALWQVASTTLQASADLKGYLEWLRYDALKASVKHGAQALSKAWKAPSVNEPAGKLVIALPEPDNISNGQRDVLILYALFQKARYSLSKKRAIIVIDEVFDYLDDANLTVAQYYLTQLIADYKNNGRELYLLILTHLNPAFFKNYAFSNQKVIYLSPDTAQAPVKAMLKLIGARENENVSEELKHTISKYLVHYHSSEIDFSADLSSVDGCRSSWGKPGKFQDFLEEEYIKFKAGQNGDPLAICAITRRSIEKQAYDQLANHPDQDGYFEEHRTGQKLDWARQRGANVPEFHYLLRIIFDDGLHWNEQRDNLVPIIAKLNNPIIRELITDAVDPCIKTLSEA